MMLRIIGITRAIKNLFKKQQTYSSLFSSAITEGIKDVFEEMGYEVKE